MLAKIETTVRPEVDEGWRRGKPVEDPQKTKRWGWVTARPSEYLVHVRRGRVRTQSSGQGATCFKWPWDAVAVVPTSLQRLAFSADQVTSEKVGVEVVGLAVYRIAEPLLAYRVLNFSFPERAQQKLEETLGAMFVGATRRLVANLSVDDCLRKRKEALAGELLREVAPIVGGNGNPDDVTARGWGVVIDTIEIQEVRVLSEKVFTAMQAPFRAELEQHAREARAAAEMAIATREAEHGRAVQEARLEAERVVGEKRFELERAKAEAHAREAVHRQELAVDEARAELAAHATRLEAHAQRVALERAGWLADGEEQRSRAEVRLVVGRADAEVALAQAAAAREHAEATARVAIAQKLPELAAAVGQRFGEVKITQIGGDVGPLTSIAQAVASVLALVDDASTGKRAG